MIIRKYNLIKRDHSETFENILVFCEGTRENVGYIYSSLRVMFS